MPIGYFTAGQVRELERSTGDLLADGTLMLRAANGVAQTVLRELRRRSGGVYGRSVGLVVGAGDNGGDALFAGATLARRGVAVCALLLAPGKTHPGGLAAFERAGGKRVDALPSRLDAAVDGIVGLGGRGPLRPEAAAVFAALDPHATVIAVDLPSGVDADTGVVHDPAVRADVTVTFGVPRRAHLLAAPQCGRVDVVDIGLPAFSGTRTSSALESLTDVEVGDAWPLPGPHDDKYTQGVVGIVAGSDEYPGAAILSTSAAVAATSGMTRYAGAAFEQVVDHRPEVVATPGLDEAGRVQAWVVGPGLGTDAAARDTVARILAQDVPVLVDADGLTVLADEISLLAGRTAPTLLTPHAGEFARLAGEPVGEDRCGAVRGLADRLGATVLLKGRVTLIAGDDRILGNDAQASWSATAGAGDVLSGIAGSLLAAGLEPSLAGAMAARLHSRAARHAATGDTPRPTGGVGHPIGASALAAALPEALRGLLALRGPVGLRQ